MNIVYNCDDNYAVHTAVSIASVFENNTDFPEIFVYILEMISVKTPAGSCRNLPDVSGRAERSGRSG